MAFALIAGLPPQYGLYASIPGGIAALWGSSRHLSTGPVAVISLLTLTSLVPIAPAGSEQFIGMAATLVLLVGILYILMSMLRLGFIVQFVPSSVIVGFTSAASLIIVIGQVPALLGLSIPQHDLVLSSLIDIALSILKASPITVILGAVSIFILFYAKRVSQYIPGPIIVLGIGAAIGLLFQPENFGVPTLQVSAQGLPMFVPPWVDLDVLLVLFPKALVIALIGLVFTHTTTSVLARKTHEHPDMNQELFGQGLASIFAAFFQGYPMSGSLSRTIMNAETGAKSALAAAVASLATLLALVALMPFFYHLPKTILAAIVISAIVPVIEISRLASMYRISRTDGIVALLTFGLAFFIRADDVILIGVIAALAVFVRQTVVGARVLEMGIDRELQILRGALAEKSVDTFPSVCIARLAMSVYYANASHIIEGIEAVITRHSTRENAPVKTLVLDVSPVNFIDITGLELFSEYFGTLQERGISIHIIYLRSALKESLERVPNFPSFKVYRNIADMRGSILFTHK